MAKVALMFGCAKQSKNLEWYLLLTYGVHSMLSCSSRVFMVPSDKVKFVRVSFVGVARTVLFEYPTRASKNFGPLKRKEMRITGIKYFRSRLRRADGLLADWA